MSITTEVLNIPNGRFTSVASVVNSKTPTPKMKFVRKSNPKRERWFVRVLMTLMIVLVGGLGTVQTATAANANPFTDALRGIFCGPEAYFYEAQPYASGWGSLGVGSPLVTGINELSSGDKNFLSAQHTAYEKYGMSGTNFTVYRGSEQLDGDRVSGVNKDDDPRRTDIACYPVVEMGTTLVANMVFNITKIVSAFSMWVYGQVYQPSWVDSLINAVSDMITGAKGVPGLRDTLYFPFLSIVIMFGALYLGWVGLVKKASIQAGQSALWMIGCVIASSLLLFNPKFIPAASSDFINTFNRAIMDTTTGIAVGATTQDPSKNFCVPGNNVDGPSEMNSKTIKTVRIMECNMWATFVYAPWVSGQWGIPTSEAWNVQAKLKGGEIDDVNTDVNLGGGKIIRGNYPLYQLEQQSLDIVSLASGNTEQRAAKSAAWFKIADNVMVDGSAYSYDWAGKGGTDRISIATMSLIAAGGALIMVVVLGLSILVYSIGMALLLFASVLFLLIGAHPGFGRGIALRWASMLLGTFLKILLSSALLGVLMAFFAIILQGGMPYGPSILAILAISIAGLMYRKTLTQAFTEIHFGGERSIGLERSAGVERAGAAATGLAVGALGAMGAAGKAASAAAANPARGRVASKMAAVGAGTKAIAKGAGAGAKSGAVTGRMTGYSAMAALRSGKQSGSSVAAKANEATQFERDERDPSVTAQRAREALRRAANYERDYNANKNNPEWIKDFRDTYGINPPDPSKTSFPGYGLKDLRPDAKSSEGRKQWALYQPRAIPQPEEVAGSTPAPTSTPTPRPRTGPGMPMPQPVTGGPGEGSSSKDSRPASVPNAKTDARPGVPSKPSAPHAPQPSAQGTLFDRSADAKKANSTDRARALREKKSKLEYDLVQAEKDQGTKGKPGSAERRVWEAKQSRIQDLRTSLSDVENQIRNQGTNGKNGNNGTNGGRPGRPSRPY